LKSLFSQLNIIFGLWSFVVFCFMIFVPMAEQRYFTIIYFPLVIFSFSIIAKIQERVKLSGKITKVLFILLVLNLTTNFALSIKYRYGVGNFFIALDESVGALINKTNDSYVIFLEDNNNSTYFLSNVNLANFSWRDEFDEGQNKDVFVIDSGKDLKTRERYGDILQKTIVSGPHCFMTYKYDHSNKKSEEYELKRNSSTRFFSDLMNSSIDSNCSIQIETRFLIPKKIRINVESSDGEVFSSELYPPVGKKMNCEYFCLYNETKKIRIKSIELIVPAGYITQTFSAKARLAKHNN